MDLSRYSVAHFDRGAPRWKEGAWVVIKGLFFQNPWPWPSALRVFFLRWFGAKVGEGVVVRANVNITFPWRLTVGDHAWIGEEATILSLAPVTVGSNVCISQRAYLCTGSHDFRSTTFDLQTKPIIINAGSWIAAQAFIGMGVEVGEGSVVSAGSVLMESVPPRSFVRGNPATVVKTLT
ncbi:MAG TPA: WcaF family extracellular polysaccharide biosynthesis acetyltransferase [Chthoniobacteraceae bacterium]|nr:WcaF family extracellular polysaccharide biosynthesis acetyltransferase [Chthoniobacteraceae bacterium]